MKLIARGPRNCLATSVATDDFVEMLAMSVGESALKIGTLARR